ncbi:MAG: hypothetical protein J7641_14425 [Cyanobacteria bacterium SID2]|nr:hypothetical protein [Cyanobacteria bacterium SID2]MBP0005111.1 hypothetical protein [Cyanobacteria bacterium SBC]
MTQNVVAIVLMAMGTLTLSTQVVAQQPQPIDLDTSNVSTRVEDLRLDEIAITPDREDGSNYPELSEDVRYQGASFEPVTIELNNPEELPQDQSSQFNLRLPIGRDAETSE